MKPKLMLCKFVLFVTFVTAWLVSPESLRANDNVGLAKDTLVIAISDNYPPFSRIDATGEPAGMLVDLWRLWAQKTGKRVEFRPSNWAGTLDGLRSGVADIHFGLFRSAERLQWIDFSRPVYTIASSFYLPTGVAPPPHESELIGKKIGVVSGYFQEGFLRENYQKAIISPYQDDEELIKALAKGEIDLFLSEDPTIEIMLGRMGVQGRVANAGVQVLVNELFFGVRKGATGLLGLINQGLDAISLEELAQIEGRWITNPERRMFKAGKKGIELTPAEKAWLREHPVIHLGTTDSWPPFDLRDSEGRHIGLHADLVQLLNQKIGANVVAEIIPKWDDLVEMSLKGDVDGILGASVTPERLEKLVFTDPYGFDPVVVLTRKDNFRIKKWDDLAGRKILIEKGSSIIGDLRKQFPTATLIQVESTDIGLSKLAEGQGDAQISWLSLAGDLLGASGRRNVKVALSINSEHGELRLGIHKSRPELAKILKKAINAISFEEQAELKSRWLEMATSEEVGAIDLSDDQRDWLEKHNGFSLGVDPAWAPFEYFDENGVYSGIGSGFIEAISARLGIDMRPMPDLSWVDVIAKAKSGEIDILPSVVRTPEREKFLNFTKPYISFPMVITTRKDMPYISGLEGLTGKKIGVVKGYVTQEMIEANHQNLISVPVDTLEEGLMMVEEGKLDAFVDNLLTISHIIQQSDLNNLKIASPTPYKFELAMGVRKDLPELIPILNKTLETIGARETNTIVNSWTAIRVKYGMETKTVFIYGIVLVLGGSLITLAVVMWARYIQKRKEIIEEKERSLHAAYDIISNSIDYAAHIQRSVLPHPDSFSTIFPDHVVIWEPRDRVGGDVYWNRIWGDGVLVILADCTGHGVPGAFMTLIVTGALDRAQEQVPPGNVAELIQRMHQLVQLSLSQHSEQGESDDGLELGACYINADMTKLTFAGARFSLFICEDSNVDEIKGDKTGIGYRGISYQQAFSDREVDLRPELSFYLTTDGLIDQVGGERNRMFGKKRFKKLIGSLNQKGIPLSEQAPEILGALQEYQGSQLRRDDLSLIAFKVL